MMSRAVASSALVGVVMAGGGMVGGWWEECEQRLKGNHRGIFWNTVSGKHLVIYHQIIIITDKLINNICSLLGLQLPKAIRQDQILRHNINYCSTILIIIRFMEWNECVSWKTCRVVER